MAQNCSDRAELGLRGPRRKFSSAEFPPFHAERAPSLGTAALEQLAGEPRRALGRGGSQPGRKSPPSKEKKTRLSWSVLASRTPVFAPPPALSGYSLPYGTLRKKVFFRPAAGPIVRRAVRAPPWWQATDGPDS